MATEKNTPQDVVELNREASTEAKPHVKGMATLRFAIEIDATPEVLKQLDTIKKTREAKTQQELVEQIFRRGLYDLSYRSKRNATQYAQFKAYKQALKSANAQADTPKL